MESEGKRAAFLDRCRKVTGTTLSRARIADEMGIPRSTAHLWYTRECERVEALGGVGLRTVESILEELDEVRACRPGRKQRYGNLTLEGWEYDLEEDDDDATE